MIRHLSISIVSLNLEEAMAASVENHNDGLK